MVVLEILSLITTIVGLYLLGKKDKYGFIVFDLSLICQMYIFYTQNNTFLIFQMVVLIVFNTINFVKWRKDESIRSL